MIRPPSISVLAATIALLAAGPFVDGRPHDSDRNGKRGSERKEQVVRGKANISLDEAVAKAERRFKARVVRAEIRNSDDGIVYVLRLLNESGRVWTVKVDAASGVMR
jgi:uncharacterized membrane protein YkoI